MTLLKKARDKVGKASCKRGRKGRLKVDFGIRLY